MRLSTIGYALLIIGMAVVFSAPSVTRAQDDPPALPDAMRVEIEATDSVILVGDVYQPMESAEGGNAAVILFHMLGSTRQAWGPLLPELHAANLFVLNVDMRGHGESGGERDWPQAEADVQLWVDWVRAQDGVNADNIVLIGASIGSNLALRGFANDEALAGVIALSPGLDYRGVTTADAVENAARRPMMLVASRLDYESAEAINTLYDLTTGDAVVRIYWGTLHGTNLFGDKARRDPLVAAMVGWILEVTANSD